jgi:hypothetical protein
MLENWYEIAMACITLSTILMQCYVGYLIRYYTPKNMHDYRFFLILLTVGFLRIFC